MFLRPIFHEKSLFSLYLREFRSGFHFKEGPILKINGGFGAPIHLGIWGPYRIHIFDCRSFVDFRKIRLKLKTPPLSQSLANSEKPAYMRFIVVCRDSRCHGLSKLLSGASIRVVSGFLQRFKVET
jgi:hypothetical protein